MIAFLSISSSVDDMPPSSAAEKEQKEMKEWVLTLECSFRSIFLSLHSSLLNTRSSLSHSQASLPLLMLPSNITLSLLHIITVRLPDPLAFWVGPVVSHNMHTKHNNSPSLLRPSLGADCVCELRTSAIYLYHCSSKDHSNTWTHASLFSGLTAKNTTSSSGAICSLGVLAWTSHSFHHKLILSSIVSRVETHRETVQ